MSLSKTEIEKLQDLMKANQHKTNQPYARHNKADREVVEENVTHALCVPNGQDSAMHIPDESGEVPVCDTENTRVDPWRKVHAYGRLDWCGKCRRAWSEPDD